MAAMNRRIGNRLVVCDARHLPLPDDSVDCIVTSPPYWGQRDYKGPSLVWGGGECRHRWRPRIWYTERSAGVSTAEAFSKPGKANVRRLKAARWRRDETCSECGAWRGQLGLEATAELYIQHLVEIFRECRRVLKRTGTCWLVISDSRPSGNRQDHGTRIGHKQETDAGCLSTLNLRPSTPNGLKYSDMLGLPHDLVKALRADGWYWRDEIIWAKPNGFCESVRSRVTRNHEYVFLLTKRPSPEYFFDPEAIMEPCASGPSDVRKMLGSKPRTGGLNIREHDLRLRASALTNIGRKRAVGGFVRVANLGHGNAYRFARAANPDSGLLKAHDPGNRLYRRKRSVWTVAVSKPRGLKHYATFPEKLIEPMILAGCPNGGLVCDPMMGSGTTGVVALRLGRKFAGFDVKPGYVSMAAKRIEGSP